MTGADPVRPPHEAVLDAAGRGPLPVEVVGSGALAGELRKQVRAPGSGDERPGTGVDTTGDIEQIELLVERVEDLGTVILAGPPVAEDATVDLYADVHVRGLTVIGVPPRGEQGG